MEKQLNKAPSLWELVTSEGVTADKKDINRLLLESLDDLLQDLMGKHARGTFYDYMERNYYIGREDVPRCLGDFLLILERTFGTQSGKIIERILAKRLCTKLRH